MKLTHLFTVAILLTIRSHALDYPHITGEPQKTGWPLTAEERAYVVEKPGMPDAWERERGLNPSSSADGNATQPDGYTNLEHYLNSLS